MKNILMRAMPAMAICASLAACGGVDLWPFRGEKNTEQSRVPANATEYRCNGGKVFHVRNIDAGGAVWLILPERQVRLDKISATRYGSGATALELEGAGASLTDGPAAYAGCKTGGEK